MADQASYVSRAFFLWAQPMIRTGFRKPLQDTERLHLPGRFLPAVVFGRFDAAWQEHVKSCSKPSLLRVLWRVLGRDLQYAVSLQLCVVVVKFTNVLLLRRLAQLIASDGRSGDLAQTAGAGLPLVAGLCCMNALEGVLASNAAFLFQLAMLGLSGCFANSVLRKGMVLHPEAQEGNKRGDLVNLAMSDCNRISEMSLVLMQGLTAPILLIVGFTLMAVLLGPLVLPAFVISCAAAFLLQRVGRMQGNAFRRKMTFQGQRLAVLNELLQSVRFTKYYVLEDHYRCQMMEARTKEMHYLKYQKMAGMWNWFVAAGVPCTIGAFVLTSFWLLNGSLPAAEDTFSLIASIRFMYLPFAFFGDFLSGINMFLAATSRLQQLLLLPEIRPLPLTSAAVGTKEGAAAVQICNANFSWALDPKQGTTLQRISLFVPRGELWVIVGAIGSGKSSLLSAILGHIRSSSEKQFDAVTASGPSRVFVAQEPMIMNASVKENITFDSDSETSENQRQQTYEKAIAAAALGPDLDILPARDYTEIGEKGITLSGGQKARIALARAVFASKPGGLVLLDDPLAAVDAQVGRHLFEACICDALKDTTRILVTNQMHFLAHSAVSRIVVMSRGQVVEEGSHAELVADPGSYFSQMTALSGKTSTVHIEQLSKAAQDETRNCSKQSGTDRSHADLTEKESESTVTLSTILYYIKQVGWCHFIIAALLSWTFHLSELIPDIFLALWQDDVLGMPANTYAIVWLVMLFIGWLSVLLCRGWWVVASQRAAWVVHNCMMNNLLRCPVSFFDKTPSGRVMNRLGEDQSLIDWIAPIMLEVLFLVGFKGLDQLLLPVVLRPLSTPFIAAACVLFLLLREVHRRSNRESIRWWMVSKSPSFHIFEETLAGAHTIFAFGREQHFLTRFEEALQKNLEWYMSKEACNHWANQRFTFLGALVVASLSCTMLFVSGQSSNSLGMVAVIQALMLGENLQWLSYFLVQVEGMFSCVERSRQFGEGLDQEPPSVQAIDASLAQQDWPSPESTLEFRNVSVRYLPHLPRALDELFVCISAKEKIGVVGRTGSGKSTVMGALFRMCPLETGQVLLGGVDVATLGLAFLRKRITIVPQDPVLFSGELRRNLDPLGECRDDILWDVLHRCGAKEMVEALEGGIHAFVAEGASNFSVGERQVLCLARALLRSAQVLCFDEATANVDPINDARIQKVLSTELESCITLTIAHRLNTIIGSDRVLVLDHGKCIQFDAPGTLLEQPGIFQDLAVQAGIELTSSAGFSL